MPIQAVALIVRIGSNDDMVAKPSKPAAPVPHDKDTVAAKILIAFTDAVSADQELKAVGERLRKVMVENRDFSDASLRAALFGDPTA
ncbi:MAG: hypothetical protein JO256_05175 [Alphaproteobacteria bacterium]|nr:hypothetical protein [Alphaproteobacteria bacterium]